jgi:hypothetical protein
MKARDFIQRLKDNLREVEEQRQTEVLRIALDATALLKLRIQTSGRNASGQAFAPYTPAYAKQRQKKGAQTGYFDFTVTGRAMANIEPRVEANETGKTVVVIGARDQENIDKIRGQFKKRGNILRLSQNEIQLVSDANQERVLKLFEI